MKSGSGAVIDKGRKFLLESGAVLEKKELIKLYKIDLKVIPNNLGFLA